MKRLSLLPGSSWSVSCSTSSHLSPCSADSLSPLVSSCPSAVISSLLALALIAGAIFYLQRRRKRKSALPRGVLVGRAGGVQRPNENINPMASRAGVPRTAPHAVRVHDALPSFPLYKKFALPLPRSASTERKYDVQSLGVYSEAPNAYSQMAQSVYTATRNAYPPPPILGRYRGPTSPVQSSTSLPYSPDTPTNRNYSRNPPRTPTRKTAHRPPPSTPSSYRESIRKASSLLVRELARPPQGIKPRDWDDVDNRIRSLVRFEHFWGKRGAGGSSTTGGSEDRERRLFCETVRDGYVLCM